jgi:hypothetical protein
MPPYWDKAAWEDTELGQMLAHEFDDYAYCSVFIILRSRADWEKLKIEELNESSSSCQCRWIPTAETAPASPTDSENTVKEVQDSNAQCGVIALRFPGYIHEKKQKGYPPSFLFGRSSQRQRYADVWFDGDTSMSRVEFILEVKNGCYVIRSLNNDLIIHQDIVIRAKEEAFALHHHDANPIVWARLQRGQRER